MPIGELDHVGWIRVRSIGREDQTDIHPILEDRTVYSGLLLRFNDVWGSFDQYPHVDFGMFAEGHADAIAQFIQSQDFDVLVINCEAGISRSAAIACEVARFFGMPHAEFEGFPYLPNPQVRAILGAKLNPS